MKLFSVFPECRYRANPECPDLPMLWRANLYVDEGQNDWNNLHPWNDPVHNEWFVSEADGAYRDGGQIKIRPWTRFSDNGRVTDAVAYSTGCADAVDHFNDDLDNQAAALTASGQPANRRNPTYAPTLQNSKWANYVFGVASTFTYSNGSTETRYNQPEYGGTTYDAITPGFSSWWYNQGGYRYIYTGYSAGVDCSGFVQRVLTYNNTPYTSIPVIGGRLAWGGSTQNLIGPQGFASDVHSYPIDEWSRVMPGDIASCDGHVGIVAKVSYSSDNTVSPSNILVIESGGSEWRVQNNRSLQYWLDHPVDFPNVTVRRMKVRQ